MPLPEFNSAPTRLIQILAEGVSAKTRQLATQYLGSCTITDASPGRLEAEVTGRRPYRVTLFRTGERVHCSCECRFFNESFEVCKHIWATVTRGVPLGFLSNMPPGSHPELIPLPDGDEEDAPLGGRPPARAADPPPWERKLQEWKSRAHNYRRPKPETTSERPLSIFFAVEPAESRRDEGLVIRVLFQEPRANGQPGSIRQISMTRAAAMRRLSEEDAAALALLCGVGEPYAGYGHEGNIPANIGMTAGSAQHVLPRLCATGRVFLHDRDDLEPTPLAWDGGGAWDLVVTFVPHADDPTRFGLVPALKRGSETVHLADAVFVGAGGLVVTRRWIGMASLRGGRPLLAMFEDVGPLPIAAADLPRVVARLLEFPDLPPIEPPPGVSLVTTIERPTPHMSVRKPNERWRDAVYDAEVAFEYDGGRSFAASDETSGWWDDAAAAAVRRDTVFEEEARAGLAPLGFKPDRYDRARPFSIAQKKLPAALRSLISRGWKVVAEGKIFRAPGAMRLSVSSGLDWFDLEGGIDFDGEVATLPALLGAAKRGESTILLGDGSLGMIPEEWMKRYGGLAGLGDASGGHVRFTTSQVGLLDALLAAQPDIAVDEVFGRARERLRTFDRIAPVKEPASFAGELRPYQREGLAWLRFLEEFGFGGCLADDMGLGKTVQVLAHVLGRQRKGPALVVCPRSLVFNWRAEAGRFAPTLRVLDHSGGDRRPPGPHLRDYDLVLTTYGILRKDAPKLAQAEFDLVVLDEAQAIKNRDTESAKAARLLRAPHRLALSGTPIENRLAELWSIFEFLNPGLLGAAGAFESLSTREADPASLTALARGIRPFILRRTKEQVVKDLPPKLEQTLFCELEGAHRRLYDELRDHYRASLLGKIETAGLGGAKIQVLEALLRLRQAACHPGLIDESRAGELSPKVETLLAQVEEVTAEGHKALVFSQFTSLLAIVRRHLDARGVTYEYLDGKTHDREAHVKHFREDASCRLFLISLKAGGLGLNLVEADYVFLLDPWWNPAVESQAIDRTHRIGQTRPVFAYRLIARDTVEEKVLELQSQKRALADAIIRADESLIRSLTREDLELLLS